MASSSEFDQEDANNNETVEWEDEDDSDELGDSPKSDVEEDAEDTPLFPASEVTNDEPLTEDDEDEIWAEEDDEDDEKAQRSQPAFPSNSGRSSMASSSLHSMGGISLHSNQELVDINDGSFSQQEAMSVSFMEEDDSNIEEVEDDPLAMPTSAGATAATAAAVAGGETEPLTAEGSQDFVDDDGEYPEAGEDNKEKDGNGSGSKIGGVCGCCCSCFTGILASILALGGVAVCIACCVVLAIIIIPIVLLVGLDLDGSNKSSSDASPANNGLPPLDLPLPLYTEQAIESNSQSPQYKAYEWMQKDPFLDDYDESRQMQRFAMATVYYAFRGENWTVDTNWLNYDVSECDWGQPTDIPYVQCGSNATVLVPSRTSPPAATLVTTTLAPNTVVPQTPAPTNESSAVADLGENNNNVTNSDIATDPSESNIFNQTKRRFLRRNLQDARGGGQDWHVLALHLPTNNLVGSMPPELAYLSNALSIDWSGNSIIGTIPTQPLTSIPGLFNFNVNGNFVTGSIPSDIRGWIDLRSLDLSNNQLTSSLATELAALPELKELDISRNRLTGQLLKDVFVWSQSMESLRLHQNQLTGPLETTIGALRQLKHLKLDYNSLNGLLPSELGKLTNLEDLLLYNNSFTGTIPTAVSNMVSLEAAELASNSLTGPIPSEIGLLTNLEDLWLYDNKLTGTIPLEVGTLVTNYSLNNVIVYGNTGLSGDIPPELCNANSIQFDCGAVAGLCGCGCSCDPNATLPPDPPGSGDSGENNFTLSPNNETSLTLAPTVESSPPAETNRTVSPGNEATLAPTSAVSETAMPEELNSTAPPTAETNSTASPNANATEAPDANATEAPNADATEAPLDEFGNQSDASTISPTMDATDDMGGTDDGVNATAAPVSGNETTTFVPFETQAPISNNSTNSTATEDDGGISSGQGVSVGASTNSTTSPFNGNSDEIEDDDDSISSGQGVSVGAPTNFTNFTTTAPFNDNSENSKPFNTPIQSNVPEADDNIDLICNPDVLKLSVDNGKFLVNCDEVCMEGACCWKENHSTICPDATQCSWYQACRDYLVPALEAIEGVNHNLDLVSISESNAPPAPPLRLTDVCAANNIIDMQGLEECRQLCAVADCCFDDGSTSCITNAHCGAYQTDCALMRTVLNLASGAR